MTYPVNSSLSLSMLGGHILLPTMMPLALTKYFTHQNVSGTYFRKTRPFYINEQNIPTQKDESG